MKRALLASLGLIVFGGWTLAQDTPSPTGPIGSPAPVPAPPASTPVAPATSAAPGNTGPEGVSDMAPGGAPETAAANATPEIRKALPVPKVVVAPPSPPLPESLVSPPPGGPVEEFVGHRKTDKEGSGWGWIKRADEDWKKGRWVTLRENAKHPAPWRALGKKDADENFEYRMWGYFAQQQVYDPIYDEMLTVFVLDHYESLGVAAPVLRQCGPEDRFANQGKASRASSRANRPMQSDQPDTALPGAR